MAAVTLSNININGYGIKKISQEHIVKGYHVGRKNSLSLSTPCAEQRRLHNNNCTQRFYDKTFTSILGSKKENGHHRNLLKCSAEAVIAPNAEVTAAYPIAPSEEKIVKEEEEISRETLIWRAMKLPMYTVALIPVTVGTAAAYWQTGLFSFARYFAILASYVLVIAWVNLSNDVYDFDTGADKNKKESVVNLFGGRTIINFVAWSLLGLGFSGLSWVAMAAGSLRSILLLTFAVFCFYLYQCPPFRLSYYGVGEPLLFVAFGPLSTIAFYLLNSRASELPISSVAVWASVLVGLTTSLILFCSHFHQIEDDKAVGKISPLVRLGTEKGSHVVKASIIGLYSLLLTLGITQTLPFASVFLSAMTLPMGNMVVSFVQKNHKDKTKIFMGKYYSVRLHTIFGAALAAGLAAARMFSAQQLQQAMVL